MDAQKSVVKNTAAQSTKKEKAPVQAPKNTNGPEIWDGNNSGWTLVSYSRKKSKK